MKELFQAVSQAIFERRKLLVGAGAAGGAAGGSDGLLVVRVGEAQPHVRQDGKGCC